MTEAPDTVKAAASPRRRPRPNPLTASARRLTTRNITRFKRKKGGDDRREDAWAMFDEVGEQHFLATTLGNRIGQARLYIGKLSPTDPTADPEPITEEDPLYEALAGFGETPAARSQLLTRAGINLFMEGDGYFVGIPREKWKQLTRPPAPGDLPAAPVNVPTSPLDSDGEREDTGIPLDDLVWRMLSTLEVEVEDDTVTLQLDETDTGKVKLSPDEILLIRVWRPHPRRWWRADSPTFASLSVLRELVGLRMHVSAQIDSRLSSAGVLVVPESAKRAIMQGAGVDPDEEDVDPIQDALIEAAETAIQNRDSAAAKVPIVITVPDDVAEHFNQNSLIKFDTGLDEQAIKLREEGRMSLAIGQDAPPEVLLGTGGMNHWGAWLVREDVITTHVEPPVALICDALTSQYLWLIAEDLMDEDAAHEYVVWYSVQHMVDRPDRLGDALQVFDRGGIGQKTLREEGGYTDEDAPPEGLTIAQQLVLDMIAKTPSLAETIGIPTLLEQITAMLGEKGTEENPDAEENEETAEEGTGDDSPADGPPDMNDEPPALAASLPPALDFILTPASEEVTV